LTWLDKGNEGRDFDVVVLADTDDFGQMLTESDQSGPDAERGRLRALEALGGNTIVRPTVLWNPSYAFTYYGDVKGVAFNSSGDTIAERTKSAGGTTTNTNQAKRHRRYELSVGCVSRTINIPTKLNRQYVF